MGAEAFAVTTSPGPQPSITARIYGESALRSAARLKEFRELRARGALCTEVTSRFESEATRLLVDEYLGTGEYLADAVTVVAEIATLDVPCLSQPGQRAPFPALVEQLSDSFDPRLCDLYDRAFVQMIAIVRRLPAGAKLDAALNEFGLRTEEALLSRKAGLRRRAAWREVEEHHRVRKVLVLSRVTLGADVAVTSVVLQRAQSLFPMARRVLLAPAKTRELFGGDASLDFRAVPYASEGTLIERLASWLDIVKAVEEEIRDLQPHEFVLLDPDSRLLQLGLLPALQDESRYFFFESRRAGSSGSQTLSRLTSEWLNETFGGIEVCLPRISLRQADRRFATNIVRRLRSGGAKWIVTMSFGVGGNMDKRLTDAFEEQLIARLVEDSSTIVLDQGAGDEERERAGRMMDLMRKRGGTVVEISAETGASGEGSIAPLRCSMLTWQGGIGTWSGLIEASDEYIGYDSAGQHIAAALGVPTVDIFTSSAAPLFQQRWHPTGEGIVRIVAAGDGANGRPSWQSALEEVLRAHLEIRSTRGR